MHDGLQFGTLAAILFGILLNRYDAVSLRKEMADLRSEVRKDMADLRTEMKRDMAELRAEMRKDMAELRSDVHRSTTLITELLFQHAERITKLESKS